MKSTSSHQTLRSLAINRHCATCNLKSCFIVKNFADYNCLDLISENKSCLTFEKSGRVISENLNEEGLYILNHGKLKIYKTDKSGVEVIIRFIKPGEVFSFFKNNTTDDESFFVRALEDSAICFLKKEALERVISEHPDVATRIAESIYQSLVDLQNRYFKTTQSHVPAKVADALIMMHEAYGQDHMGALNVKLSREDIAGLATTTKEQVSKVISELKTEGIIKAKGRKIEIVNIARLKDAAAV